MMERVQSELELVSSIWLQFIWLAVGSTVKTRDLIKLNNNSILTAFFLSSRIAQVTCAVIVLTRNVIEYTVTPFPLLKSFR